MPTLDLDGVPINYDRKGSGPVAIALHGLSYSRSNDRESGLDWASALAPSHEVITYDARGHGKSGGRAVAADYSWSALATDLLRIADEFSPNAPVDAVGSSMGAGTILHAAVQAPQRFRRLVLAIPPTAWSTRAAQRDTYEQGATLIEQHGLRRFVMAAKLAPRPAVLEGQDWIDPDVSEELLPTVMRGAALSDLPEPFEIAGISCPTLILAWAGDPGHPLSTAERLADLLHRTTLRIARTPEDLAQWPALAAAHLTA